MARENRPTVTHVHAGQVASHERGSDVANASPMSHLRSPSPDGVPRASLARSTRGRVATATSTTLRSVVTQGVLAGIAGTQALDAVSIWLYDEETPLARFRENRARGFLHAYERAVERIARRFGRRLTRREKEAWGWRFHKAFGLAGGLLYAVLRRRFPVVARGSGLVFGAAFFLIVDEVLMPVTALTPGPRAFDWKVHGRGAVAHVAWGVAAESALRLAGRLQQRLARA